MMTMMHPSQSATLGIALLLVLAGCSSVPPSDAFQYISAPLGFRNTRCVKDTAVTFSTRLESTSSTEQERVYLEPSDAEGGSDLEPANDGGLPILTEWQINSRGHFVGKVINHPRFGNGSVITTSKLSGQEVPTEGSVIITETGSEYRLGAPLDLSAVAAGLDGIADSSEEIGVTEEDVEDAAEQFDAQQNQVNGETSMDAAEEDAARELLRQIEERNRIARERLEAEGEVIAEVKKFKTLRERFDFEQAERRRLAEKAEAPARISKEQEQVANTAEESVLSKGKKKVKTLREQWDDKIDDHPSRRILY
mmetsp:Transcript_36427/g.74168  ORF Transcript_36427/g.74168 Transcript_36427/m.74168 type:complete len:309 (+) Transcript_36427:54-980(+)